MEQLIRDGDMPGARSRAARGLTLAALRVLVVVAAVGVAADVLDRVALPRMVVDSLGPIALTHVEHGVSSHQFGLDLLGLGAALFVVLILGTAFAARAPRARGTRYVVSGGGAIIGGLVAHLVLDVVSHSIPDWIAFFPDLRGIFNAFDGGDLAVIGGIVAILAGAFLVAGETLAADRAQRV